MKFYFYNSYQNSPVGFQLSKCNDLDNNLALINSFDIKSEEIRSLLLNSGTVCAIGKTTQGHNYFVIKGISVADDEGVKWYVNIALESDGIAEEYKAVVYNILTDYSDFKKICEKYMSATNGIDLSYNIDVAAFKEAILSMSVNERAAEFLSSAEPMISEIKDALENPDNKSLLVLEATEKYFASQNPVFNSKKFDLILDSDEFKNLLIKDVELFVSYQKVKTQKAEQKQAKATYKQNNDTVEMAKKGLLIEGGLFAVGCAGYVFKKFIFRG